MYINVSSYAGLSPGMCFVLIFLLLLFLLLLLLPRLLVIRYISFERDRGHHWPTECLLVGIIFSFTFQTLFLHLLHFIASLSLYIHKRFRFRFVNFDSRALWGLSFQTNEMSLTQTRTGHLLCCLSSIVPLVCFVEIGWKGKRRKVQPKKKIYMQKCIAQYFISPYLLSDLNFH